jgi:hypothetical protein
MILTIILLGVLVPLENNQGLRKIRVNNEIEDLEYFQLMKDAFNLTDAELQLLDQNDFVVLNRLGVDHLLDTFYYYWKKDLPIVITSDTMLHTWHLIFNEILKQYEELLLVPVMNEWALSVYNSIDKSVFSTDDPIVLDVLIYLTVGACLIDPGIAIPSSIANTTNQIVKAIYDEITPFEAIEQFQTYQVMRFIDDFTMYRPRGHYTQSEQLQDYFRLIKWFSRIPFFFDDYSGEIYLQRTPLEMIREVVYLIDFLKGIQVNIPEFGLDASALEVYTGFQNFLNALAGLTYTIPIEKITQVVESIEETDSWKPDNIDENDLLSIQEQILNDNTVPIPKDLHLINLLTPFFPEVDPKTFLLFGERLNLDTYAGNHLVFPYVQDSSKRMPNGLEIASTIMHSERARTYLSLVNDSQYQTQLTTVHETIDNWPVDEKQALTWQWMETLRELSSPEPAFNGSSPLIPSFMKTNAWQDEKLTSVLGSWAELKHDTILYQKQGLTWGACSTPEGFVEPYPTLYQKLNHLGQVFKTAIDNLQMFDLDKISNPNYPYNNLNYSEVFTDFDNITRILEGIAYKELQGEALTSFEKEFLKTTYRYFTFSGTVITGWLGDLLSKVYKTSGYPEEEPKSALIADIHTDLYYQTVLEVGTGMFEHLIARVPGWNGTDILAIGPVFSYYEFKVPMENRMTDEDWRGIFDLRYTYPNIPQDDYRIFARGPWAQNYMVSTEMTADRLIQQDFGHPLHTAPVWFLDSLDVIITYPETSSSTSGSTTITESVTTGTTGTSTTPSWSILLVLVSIICLSSFGRKRRKK